MPSFPRELLEELDGGPICTSCIAVRRGFTRVMVERMVLELLPSFAIDTEEPCRQCGACQSITLQGPDLRSPGVADIAVIGKLILGTPLCFDCIGREGREDRAKTRAILQRIQQIFVVREVEHEPCGHCGLDARTYSVGGDSAGSAR
jgi:hypothetical protein